MITNEIIKIIKRADKEITLYISYKLGFILGSVLNKGSILYRKKYKGAVESKKYEKEFKEIVEFVNIFLAGVEKLLLDNGFSKIKEDGSTVVYNSNNINIWIFYLTYEQFINYPFKIFVGYEVIEK